MGVKLFKLHVWADVLPVDLSRFSGSSVQALGDFSPLGKMEPVQTVPPGTPSRSITVPTKAQKDLLNYTRSNYAWPDDFPLIEPWAWEGICPECEEESIIARDDYICVHCRNA